MGKYGDAAVLATELLTTKKEKSPRVAWEIAVTQIFPDSESSQEKGCPRDSFLALCEGGHIKGVTAGSYTKSVKNKAYALRALSLLRSTPTLLDDEKQLWQMVINGEKKTPNHQMEVVTTLWRKGFILERH